jgi:hypothetical protein
VVGPAGKNRLDQQRDVFRIVRSVRIHENGDGCPDLRDGAADGLAFPETAVHEHARTALLREIRRAVGRVSIDDDNLGGIAARPDR